MIDDKDNHCNCWLKTFFFLACTFFHGVNCFSFNTALSLGNYDKDQAICSPAALNFEEIPNFRQVIPDSEIFRSAEMEKASPDDLKRLNEDIAIRTVIDLRGDLERQFPDQCCLAEDFQVLKGHEALSNTALLPSSRRRCFQISLLEAERQYSGMYERMPLHLKVQAVWWSLFSGKKETELYMKSINAGGLETLYQVMLDTSKRELCQALKIVAEPSNHPVVFHCVKGKDRTGLLSMLILHCFKYEKKDIINDYSISWNLLQIHDNRKRGLISSSFEEEAAILEEIESNSPTDLQQTSTIDWSKFKGTPPSAMQATLDYIEEKYGSLNNFLDEIGFTSEWRQKLCSVGRKSPLNPSMSRSE